MQLMQILMSSPQLQQQYGPAHFLICLHQNKLLGVRDLKQYSPKPAQANANQTAQMQLQAGMDPATGLGYSRCSSSSSSSQPNTYGIRR